MQKLEETVESVELAGSAYYNMLRSIIETIPRESMGDLLGRKFNNEYICINAYPMQTANRKLGSVNYDESDEKAVDRVRSVNKTSNRLGGLGTYLIGGYHSHINSTNKLSDSDIKHIIAELDELKKDYWIEITLALKEKRYPNPKQTGEFVKEYARKLRVTLRDTQNHGYDITISAYKVTNPKKPRVKELKVRRRRVKVVKVNTAK